jgi:hypothetical protein
MTTLFSGGLKRRLAEPALCFLEVSAARSANRWTVQPLIEANEVLRQFFLADNAGPVGILLEHAPLAPIEIDIYFFMYAVWIHRVTMRKGSAILASAPLAYSGFVIDLKSSTVTT